MARKFDTTHSFLFFRSIFSFIPHFLAAAFIIAGLVILEFWVHDVDINLTRWLAIVPALFLLNILRLFFNNRYLFGQKRIRLYLGLLSFYYQRPSIDYYDIREVQVRQDVFGRIFNYGDIIMGIAGVGDHDRLFTIQAVDNPQGLADNIEVRRKARKVSSENPSAE